MEEVTGNRCRYVCTGVLPCVYWGAAMCVLGWKWGVQASRQTPGKVSRLEPRNPEKGIKGTPPRRNALCIVQLEWDFWPQSWWDGNAWVLSVLALSTTASHRPLHKMVDLQTDMGSSMQYVQSCLLATRNVKYPERTLKSPTFYPVHAFCQENTLWHLGPLGTLGIFRSSSEKRFPWTGTCKEFTH